MLARIMPKRRLLVAGLGLVAVVACGTTKHKAPPPPPPTLAITAIGAVGGTSLALESTTLAADGSLASQCGGACCVEVGTDAIPTVVVTATLSDPNFLLRPPGMCGGNTQCGYLALEVDPSEAGPLRIVRSAIANVLLPAADLEGLHRIYVELRSENDLPMGDAEGQAVHAEVDVVLSPPGGCSALPDAGVDAMTDAAGDSETDAAGDSETDAAGDSETDSGAASEDAGQD